MSNPLRWKVITRINGKQVDLAYARDLKTAVWIMRKILLGGFEVYDVKKTKRINISIKELE